MRKLILAVMVVLLVPASAQATTGKVTATMDCAAINLAWSGFPDPVVNYRMTVDGKAFDGQVTFAHTAKLKLPVPLFDPFRHTVQVFSWWDAQTYMGQPIPAGGSQTVPLATAECGTGSPPPPKTCPGCPPQTVCKKCVSRRILPIRIIEGTRKYVSATVTLAGRKVKAKRENGRLVARIDFRELAGPNVFVATIRARTRAGRTVTGHRLYRVCTADDGVRINFDRTRL